MYGSIGSHKYLPIPSAVIFNPDKAGTMWIKIRASAAQEPVANNTYICSDLDVCQATDFSTDEQQNDGTPFGSGGFNNE
jgi:hypothetical protein